MKKDYLRLRANRDFKSVFENGDFAKGKFLKVGVLKNSLKSNRFGVCIPRVLTKSAVTRNTLKRRTREAFRMNANKIKSGLDVVAVLRSGTSNPKESSPQEGKLHKKKIAGILTYEVINDGLLELLGKLGCLSK